MKSRVLFPSHPELCKAEEDKTYQERDEANQVHPVACPWLLHFSQECNGRCWLSMIWLSHRRSTMGRSIPWF